MKITTAALAVAALGLALNAITPASAATPPGKAQGAANKTRAPDRFPIHAIELAYELSPLQMRLPDAGASFMLVQPCAKCATQSLALDAKSQFLLNNVALPLAELRRQLGTGSNWSATALYIPGELRLTRLLVVSP